MKYKSFLRRALLLVLIAALSIAVSAQQTQTTNVPSVERLRAHIEYLASDKLEGRRTGSSGANAAAEYIAKEFARYGLRRSIGHDLPGMSILEADSPRRYMQEFPYVAGVELGKNNLLLVKAGPRIDAAQARVGEDWMPLGFSANNKIDKVGVAFAGYGISSTELKYDDYAATNAKDRVAIVFSGTPDGDNPHGQFALAGGVRFKAAAARAAGARALIIIASELEFRDDKLSRLNYDNAGDAGLPVIVVSRRMAQGVLFWAKLSEFESVADSGTTFVKAKPNPPVKAEASVTMLRQLSVALRLPNDETSVTMVTDVVRRAVPAWNVVGILDGSDPTLKNETIVVGAHYDHLGRGGEGSLAPREGEIHHGADDNASGVAGVLELARLFSGQHPRPRRTLVFIAFSGEEEGLLGSNYYVNHPITPLANTVAMINMDMIGRMKNNNLIIGGVGTAQSWRSMIDAQNLVQSLTVTARSETSSSQSKGMPMVVSANGRTIVASDSAKQFALTLSEDGFGPSDHSSFYAKQIAVLFLWTGTHEDYHKPSDTADKINYDDETRILSLVARLIKDIDKNDKRPVYTVAKTESTGRSTGFRVYLGTIPNYADSNDGLLLDGVREDSPAAKAGLKAGDRVMKLAGRDVHNVYDYTYALGEMKAGQEYEAEVLRGTERLKLKITPAARK